jgi:hypothetical protein
LYILHHLGLGDHIICNGLVRFFYSSHAEIFLFCLSNNYENIKYMFRDLENLHLLKFNNEKEIQNYIDENSNIMNDLLSVGYYNQKYYTLLQQITFDKCFYFQACLNFDIRFSEFNYERNYISEEKVYKKLNPNDEAYILVFDDPSRGFVVNDNKINSKLKIIRNDYNYLMFDYLKLIENATEIHAMQSGFLDLINSYKLSKPKIFRHRYIRNYTDHFHNQGLNKIYEIY